MKKGFPAFFMLLCLSLSALEVDAVDLAGLLAEGPVITVKQSPQGKFMYASALVQVNAPPEVVWDIILDLDHYKDFMPRVVYSKIQTRSDDGSVITVKFELNVPLINQRYTLKYCADQQKKVINITHIAGDLPGSWWQWKLMPHAKGTLIQYIGATKNYSALLQKFEDEQQTVTVGVNVSSVMTVTRTIKRMAEKIYREKK